MCRRGEKRWEKKAVENWGGKDWVGGIDVFLGKWVRESDTIHLGGGHKGFVLVEEEKKKREEKRGGDYLKIPTDSIRQLMGGVGRHS